jgi:hypothetical protein
MSRLLLRTKEVFRKWRNFNRRGESRLAGSRTGIFGDRALHGAELYFARREGVRRGGSAIAGREGRKESANGNGNGNGRIRTL